VRHGFGGPRTSTESDASSPNQAGCGAMAGSVPSAGSSRWMESGRKFLPQSSTVEFLQLYRISNEPAFCGRSLVVNCSQYGHKLGDIESRPKTRLWCGNERGGGGWVEAGYTVGGGEPLVLLLILLETGSL
jgi:hypothetical protein